MRISVSLTAAANDAKSNASQLKLLRSTLPTGLLTGGLVLLLIGIALILSGRRFRPPLGDEELADVLLSGEERVPTRL